MNAINSPARPMQDSDIVITRVFDAPRELVFKALTDPEHLMRWWAPQGCSTPYCRVDLRVGGTFHYCMRLPGGRDIWGLGVYREIVEPELIVYSDTFADSEGNPVPPSHYGMTPGHPHESLVTLTFDQAKGKTRLTLRHSIPASVVEREATSKGWTDMLDRLAEELATMEHGT
jgi:uncharacterized protein YndB with AHSA1/START domain